MSGPDVVQLAPRLHRLRIPGGAAHLLNCYLWVGETGVTLVDTGWPDSAEVIAEALLTNAAARIGEAIDAFA